MELLRPSSADEATAALGNGAVALAGGTELVPLLRDGLIRADKLVHLAAAVPRGVDGTTIGGSPSPFEPRFVRCGSGTSMRSVTISGTSAIVGIL